MPKKIPTAEELAEIRQWMWEQVDLHPTDIDRLCDLYYLSHPIDEEIDARFQQTTGSVDPARYVAMEIQSFFARGWRKAK